MTMLRRPLVRTPGGWPPVAAAFADQRRGAARIASARPVGHLRRVTREYDVLFASA